MAHPAIEAHRRMRRETSVLDLVRQSPTTMTDRHPIGSGLDVDGVRYTVIGHGELATVRIAAVHGGAISTLAALASHADGSAAVQIHRTGRQVVLAWTGSGYVRSREYDAPAIVRRAEERAASQVATCEQAGDRVRIRAACLRALEIAGVTGVTAVAAADAAILGMP